MLTERQPINEAQLIRLPAEPTDQHLIDGIRHWLELLAARDYGTAVEAVYFRWGRTPGALRKQIEEFFGAEHRSTPDRPTEEVLRRSEVYREGIPQGCKPGVGFIVPLVNELRIWATFLVRAYGESSFFEFEDLSLFARTPPQWTVWQD
jgi:hypothetical protein